MLRGYQRHHELRVQRRLARVAVLFVGSAAVAGVGWNLLPHGTNWDGVQSDRPHPAASVNQVRPANTRAPNPSVADVPADAGPVDEATFGAAIAGVDVDDEVDILPAADDSPAMVAGAVAATSATGGGSSQSHGAGYAGSPASGGGPTAGGRGLGMLSAGAGRPGGPGTPAVAAAPPADPASDPSPSSQRPAGPQTAEVLAGGLPPSIGNAPTTPLTRATPTTQKPVGLPIADVPAAAMPPADGDAPKTPLTPVTPPPQITGPPVAEVSPRALPPPVTGNPGAVPGTSPGQGSQGPAPATPAPSVSDPADPSIADARPALPGDPVAMAPETVDDGWISPGNSPGTLALDGDFVLDGGTLLFEILGTEAGVEYDQLIVNGDVNLDEGNVVFAFIDGFKPASTDIFEVILADLITLSDAVDFYYGVFDSDPWDINAPHNLAAYTLWDRADSVLKVDTSPRNGGQSLNVRYEAPKPRIATDQKSTVTAQTSTTTAQTRIADTQGPDKAITPLAIPIPGPAPLMLLSVGLIALGLSARRRRR